MDDPFDRSHIIRYNRFSLEIQSYPKLRFFGGWQQIDKVILDGDVLGEIRTRSVGNKREVTTHVMRDPLRDEDNERIIEALKIRDPDLYRRLMMGPAV